MEGVAGVLEVAADEAVRPRWTGFVIRAEVALADAEDHFADAVFRGAPAAVPPADAEVGRQGPLADQDGVALAVADVGERDLGIGEERAVVPETVAAENPEVRRVG